MKIVADENIPYLDHYFTGYGELLLKPGRTISTTDLHDADILLVRSVTTVNQALLQNTPIQFVGSATTGFNHLDRAWLSKQGIRWSVAQGCNATAVVEYVICAIAALQKKGYLVKKEVRAAVIGVGNIGEQVADKLKCLGFDVLLCDPFRKDLPTIPFEQLTDLDFVSLHLPLTQEGLHPTYHLIQKDFFTKQKKSCVLVNTGRGEVLASEQLKQYGQPLIWCLDVWENEPYLDFGVLQPALIATPHIAGYSRQSKLRGVEMLYAAALKEGILTEKRISPIAYPQQTITLSATHTDWRDVVLAIFDPIAETNRMKSALCENANVFDLLRKNFMERYEFQFVAVQGGHLSDEDRQLLIKLGLSVV